MRQSEYIAKLLVLTMAGACVGCVLIIAVTMIINPVRFVERLNACVGEYRTLYPAPQQWADASDPEKLRNSRRLRREWQVFGVAIIVGLFLFLLSLSATL